MDQTSSMVAGFSGFNGFNIVDSNGHLGGFLPPLINAYSVMTIPAYWRATNFLANNLMKFPRYVTLNGVRVAHPLDGILSRRPNQYQSCADFWRTFWFHACHYGSGYARIVGDIASKSVSVHNVLPDAVVPYRYALTNDDIAHPERWEQWYYLRPTKETLHSSEVLVVNGLSYNGMTGFNPVIYLRETFQRALMQDHYYSRFLAKGTMIRGSIEIPQGATEEQIEEILSIISRRHSGANADNDVLVLSGGAKLNNSTLSPRESQLDSMLDYTEKQISQITGVPPQFLYEFKEGTLILLAISLFVTPLGIGLNLDKTLSP